MRLLLALLLLAGCIQSGGQPYDEAAHALSLARATPQVQLLRRFDSVNARAENCSEEEARRFDQSGFLYSQLREVVSCGQRLSESLSGANGTATVTYAVYYTNASCGAPKEILRVKVVGNYTRADWLEQIDEARLARLVENAEARGDCGALLFITGS